MSSNREMISFQSETEKGQMEMVFRAGQILSEPGIESPKQPIRKEKTI